MSISLIVLGNSDDGTQGAGNSAGLRGPGGLPLVTPLDPDKPSGFYGRATPNEAATSALPYLRFMSDLMNPSATASELFNKGDEATGGKKSADNGKNEQHGDGGRRIQKSDTQVRELRKRLIEVKTRREKKQLKKKIERVEQAAQRAKSGEAHSQRGKGAK